MNNALFATFVLRDPVALKRAGAFIRANWLACAQQGEPVALIVQPAKSKRTDAQNRLYWRVLAQIAEGAWIDGRTFSKEAWHHELAGRFIGHEDGPGGQRVPISTTRLGVADFTAYIERVMAYAAQELGIEVDA